MALLLKLAKRIGYGIQMKLRRVVRGVPVTRDATVGRIKHTLVVERTRQRGALLRPGPVIARFPDQKMEEGVIRS